MATVEKEKKNITTEKKTYHRNPIRSIKKIIFIYGRR